MEPHELSIKAQLEAMTRKDLNAFAHEKFHVQNPEGFQSKSVLIEHLLRTFPAAKIQKRLKPHWWRSRESRILTWIGVVVGVLSLLIGVWYGRKGGSSATEDQSGPLPIADSSKYSIAVARFVNDTNQQYELLVTESLLELDGVQPLRINRSIPPPAEGAGDSANVYAKVHRYLSQTRADVLLWGTVLRIDNRSRVKIRWTPNENVGRRKDWSSYAVTEDVSLPELFWDDLSSLLRLMVVTSHARDYIGTEREGKQLGAELAGYIAKVRHLVENRALVSRWSDAERRDVLFAFGNALRVYGTEVGDAQSVREAVGYLRQSIALINPKTDPHRFAATQNLLGNALRWLGSEGFGNEFTNQSLAAYRQALAALNGTADSIHWAFIQDNLGTSLADIADREGDTTYYRQAAQAAGMALSRLRREQAPADWATVHLNLGDYILELGKASGNESEVFNAIHHYQEALTVFTQATSPLDWALSHQKLGLAYAALGAKDEREDYLEQALGEYRAALTVYTRQRTPTKWAMVTNNAALVQMNLGTLKSQERYIVGAIADLNQLLSVYTRQAAPRDWAIVQVNLGLTHRMLGSLRKDAAPVCEALPYFKAALDGFGDEPNGRSYTLNEMKTAVQQLRQMRDEECLRSHRDLIPPEIQ